MALGASNTAFGLLLRRGAKKGGKSVDLKSCCVSSRTPSRMLAAKRRQKEGLREGGREGGRRRSASKVPFSWPQPRPTQAHVNTRRESSLSSTQSKTVWRRGSDSSSWQAAEVQEHRQCGSIRQQVHFLADR